MLRVFWLQESVFFQDRLTVILMSFVCLVNRHSLPAGNMRMCYQSLAVMWTAGIAILHFCLSHAVFFKA